MPRVCTERHEVTAKTAGYAITHATHMPIRPSRTPTSIATAIVTNATAVLSTRNPESQVCEEQEEPEEHVCHRHKAVVAGRQETDDYNGWQPTRQPDPLAALPRATIATALLDDCRMSLIDTFSLLHVRYRTCPGGHPQESPPTPTSLRVLGTTVGTYFAKIRSRAPVPSLGTREAATTFAVARRTPRKSPCAAVREFADMTHGVLVLAPYLQRGQAGAAQATINIVNALAERYPGGVSVFTFAYDAELLHPALRIVGMARRPEPRFFWRFAPIVFLRECYRHFKAAGVPAAGFCYTQNTSMALAYRRIHPSVRIISHTGAVLADREFRDETHGSAQSALELAIGEWLIKHIEQRSYRQSNWRHIVSTRLVARQRQQYFGLPPGFFTVRPYGLDLKRFDRLAHHEDMRARHDIPRQAFLIVSVARLIRWKNLDMILHAIARSRAQPWLFVVGSGPEQESLQALAQALQIQQRVRFVGHADPAPFLACSDLFALPSRIESFGMAYAEAMSMGLPCLGLRNRPPDVLSSAEDVIPEGKAGYCVGSVDELRDRIDDLAASPETVRQLGEFAYRLATSEYTTQRYLECLDSLRSAR